MPKIIYRPNPTPTPFPPPTPVPTENLVSFAPYPFVQDDNVTASFTNVQNPQTFDFAELHIKFPDTTQAGYVADLNILPNGTIEPAEFLADYPSTGMSEISIKYFSDNGGSPVVVATVPLYCTNE